MKGGEIFVLKMQERSIVEFAEEAVRTYGNGAKIEFVYTGLRPGERLNEVLLTEDELTHTKETKDMFIVLPQVLAQPPSKKRA